MNNCIFIIAGEVSGDMFGANLVSKILAINSQITFYGLGGDKMRQSGVVSSADRKLVKAMLGI